MERKQINVLVAAQVYDGMVMRAANRTLERGVRVTLTDIVREAIDEYMGRGGGPSEAACGVVNERSERATVPVEGVSASLEQKFGSAHPDCGHLKPIPTTFPADDPFFAILKQHRCFHVSQDGNVVTFLDNGEVVNLGASKEVAE